MYSDSGPETWEGQLEDATTFRFRKGWTAKHNRNFIFVLGYDVPRQLSLVAGMAAYIVGGYFL